MKYKVEIVRVEYLSQMIEVEVNNRSEAMDLAWDQSVNNRWACVEADEFTNNVEEIV